MSERVFYYVALALYLLAARAVYQSEAPDDERQLGIIIAADHIDPK